MSRNAEQRTTHTQLNWSLVWKNHSRWLRRVLCARLRCNDEVDEVFQEIALVVARKPDRWPDGEKIAPWLYRVAIQQVFLHRRKSLNKHQPKTVDHLDEPITESIEQPVTILMSRESSELLQMAMNQLCGQDREMLLLKHAEGWSYREISQRTGLTQDKVIYRIGRARTRLRQTLCKLNSQWTELNEDKQNKQATQ